MNYTINSRPMLAQSPEQEREQAITLCRAKIAERSAELQHVETQRAQLLASVPANLREAIAPAVALFDAKCTELAESLERYEARLYRLVTDVATPEDALESLSRLVATVGHGDFARFKKGGDLHNLRGYRLTIDVHVKGHGVEYSVSRRRNPLGSDGE